VLRLIAAVSLAGLGAATLEAQTSGVPWDRNERRVVRSDVLGESREIWVRTPVGYRDGGERYPLLVVLDGEAHFDYVAGFADLLAQYFEVPRMIVVGVPNAPGSRSRDFGTTRLEAPAADGSGTARFAAFLASELLPYLEREYRTVGLRVLAGHSLTGQFAASTLLADPGRFQAFIAVSPSMQRVTDDLDAATEAWLAGRAGPPVPLFVGTAGARDNEALVTGAQRLVSLLERSPGRVRAQYLAFEGETHGTVPTTALRQGLRWVFEGWAPSYGRTVAALAERGPAPLLAHYEELSGRFGTTLAPTVEHLLFFAGRLSGNGKIEAARALIDQADRLDPLSWRAAEAGAALHAGTGDLRAAAAAYAVAADRAAALEHPAAVSLREEAERLAARVARREAGAEANRYWPGLIDTPADEYGLAFAPDGRRAYWVRRADRSGDETIVWADRAADGWTAPRPVFETGHHDVEPFVSPDGARLLFASTRASSAEGDDAYDLWVSEATEGGWSDPVRLPATVNGDGYDNYPSVARNGNLYFGSRRPGSEGIDLYVARFVGGEYLEAETLGPVINSSATDADPYIAPDESFLIFSSTRDGGYGSGDLYLSTRADGRWSEPVNLGPAVNDEEFDYAPTLSPDGSEMVYAKGWGQILAIPWPAVGPPH